MDDGRYWDYVRISPCSTQNIRVNLCLVGASPRFQGRWWCWYSYDCVCSPATFRYSFLMVIAIMIFPKLGCLVCFLSMQFATMIFFKDASVKRALNKSRKLCYLKSSRIWTVIHTLGCSLITVNQSPLLNRFGTILKAKKYVASWNLMNREGITNAYCDQSLVVNPVQIPQLESELDVIANSFSKKATPSQHSHSEDIFNTLPLELRHEIFKLLPAGSILALKAASLVMHSTALPCDLWKRTLMSEIPWLWEVHDIDAFQSQGVEDSTSKLLLDIQKKSRYTSENDDYIFGLANRRRIWGICEQIRSHYLKKLKGISNAES